MQKSVKASPRKASKSAKAHFSEQKLHSVRSGEARALQMFEESEGEEEEGDDYHFSDIDNA